MCGISGFIDYPNADARHILERMNQLLFQTAGLPSLRTDPDLDEQAQSGTMKTTFTDTGSC
jgi:hypothetical protein